MENLNNLYFFNFFFNKTNFSNLNLLKIKK